MLAVEMGFMSCSRRRLTPVEYMGDGDNVLWKLLQSGEDDAGFHSGADISMLSQFAGEEEVLFPPITMLVVQRRAAEGTAHVDAPAQPAWNRFGLSRSASAAAEVLEVYEDEGESADGTVKSFLACAVRPSFV